MRDNEDRDVEQVHEDWKKGQYEFMLTKKVFQVSQDISDAMRVPYRPYIQKAVASLMELLSVMISGEKKANKKPFEKNLKLLDNIYLLLNRGIFGLSLMVNKKKYTLKWETGGGSSRDYELRNKQVIPLVLSDIFRETVKLGPQLGYFLQKPFEKQTGTAGLFAAAGIDLESEMEP